MEKEIANKVSDLGIGPKQYNSKEGYLHEEFIIGTPLLMLEDSKCTPDFMEKLGKKFINTLQELHSNDIVVNDQILTNDFGKSHLIIDEKNNVRFIDFGASISIENFPFLSNEQIFSLMRTDPYMGFRIHNILSLNKEQKESEILKYKEAIISQLETKQDLIRWKDFQLLNEGLSFLRNRLPNVDFFVEGIMKNLNK